MVALSWKANWLAFPPVGITCGRQPWNHKICQTTASECCDSRTMSRGKWRRHYRPLVSTDVMCAVSIFPPGFEVSVYRADARKMNKHESWSHFLTKIGCRLAKTCSALGGVTLPGPKRPIACWCP